jgi:hypothetical protein
MNLGIGLDKYDRNARLKPALLAILPLAWTAMSWAPGHELGWGGLWSLFVLSGGTFLLAQMARDGGKALEAKLFQGWGGRPTERSLSYAGCGNPALLRRRHALLRGLVPDAEIPSSPEQESADREGAGQAYAACTSWLINKTRNRAAYPLVFAENCAYGFRRNLIGLKPYGLAVSLVCAAVLGLRLAGQFLSHETVSPWMLGAEALNILLALAWTFVFRRDWVRVPADAYAERLLETLDSVSEQR